MYLPGDINGLTKKLHLLAADFFADNTTIRNELVHVLDALLRLKQLTRKEEADITACEHDWITSRLIRDESHVGYSCKDSDAKYLECSKECRSTLDRA